MENNKKIYARQIPPEYQESPLTMFDEWPENIGFYGNRHYSERIPENIENAIKKAADMAEVIDSFESSPDEWNYKNITEIMRDCFPCIKWTTRRVHAARVALAAGTQCRGDGFEEWTALLDIVIGGHWETGILRGCSQSDWINVIYDADKVPPEELERIEAEYFNTGSEWIIHDETEKPETPDDISGYSLYCYSWNNDGIKEEIAAAAGCSAADVVLYKFDGYSRAARYNVA